MKFRTEITPHESNSPILHSEKILTLGSCFAENIAAKLEMHKFRVISNPFGVLYNPVSIRQSVQLLTGSRNFTAADLFEFSGEWHSFYHDSFFSSEEKEKTLGMVQHQINSSVNFLKSADVIIITYGTSYIYNYRKTGMTVSNCHKLPSSEFERKRLAPEEVFSEGRFLLDEIKKVNGNARFIFTVSPIRHWKDGAFENQLSKASLLLGISEIIKNYKNCRYFPAYEIMMDDLRDYRFYAEDLLHPNKQAIDYIWEKFLSAEISRTADEAIGDFGKIYTAVNHIPKDKFSEKYKDFCRNQLKEIAKLQEKYQYVELTDEIKYFTENSG